MYPPVGIGQVRVAEKHDLVLGGKLKIPAGTIMWVSAQPLTIKSCHSMCCCQAALGGLFYYCA